METIYIVKLTQENPYNGEKYLITAQDSRVKNWVDDGGECYIVTSLKKIEALKTFIVFEDETLEMKK